MRACVCGVVQVGTLKGDLREMEYKPDAAIVEEEEDDGEAELGKKSTSTGAGSKITSGVFSFFQS